MLWDAILEHMKFVGLNIVDWAIVPINDTDVKYDVRRVDMEDFLGVDRYAAFRCGIRSRARSRCRCRKCWGGAVFLLVSTSRSRIRNLLLCAGATPGQRNQQAKRH